MEPQSISCPLVLQVSTNCYHYKFMKCVYVPNRGKIWWYFGNKHIYKFENFLKQQIINELDRTIGGLGWLANCSWFRGAPIKIRRETKCFYKTTMFINISLNFWKLLSFRIISEVRGSWKFVIRYYIFYLVYYSQFIWRQLLIGIWHVPRSFETNYRHLDFITF